LAWVLNVRQTWGGQGVVARVPALQVLLILAAAVAGSAVRCQDRSEWDGGGGQGRL